MTMVLPVTISLGLLLTAAILMSRNRRSMPAWVLVLLSAVPLLAMTSTAKAIFTWLAIIGIAGFAVTVYQGLRAEQEGSA